jgi:hypothetical protein
MTAYVLITMERIRDRELYKAYKGSVRSTIAGRSVTPLTVEG